MQAAVTVLYVLTKHVKVSCEKKLLHKGHKYWFSLERKKYNNICILFIYMNVCTGQSQRYRILLWKSFFFFFYISPENINNPSYHTLLKGKKTPNCDYYRRFVHMTDNITEPYVERLDNLVIAMFV